MKKIGSTASGTVIVEMTEAEFVRLEKLPAFASGTVKRMTHEERITYARDRLKKLNPKTKEAAVHSIQAMFQFQDEITPAEAERIFTSLQKEKSLPSTRNPG